MSENLEKYRTLYSLLNDPGKSRLFGDGQPFGRNCADRALFKNFADWVDELSREKRMNPVTINSKTFIARLVSLQEDDAQEIAEMIKKIRICHENKVISDEPLQNTLYQFAEIIDELKVISDNEPGDVLSRYTDALNLASKLQPLAETRQAAKSKKESVAKSEAGIKSESGIKPGAGVKSESVTRSESGIESESESVASSSAMSSSEVRIDAQNESTITDQETVPGNGFYANFKESEPLEQKTVQPVKPTRPAQPTQSIQPAQPIQPIQPIPPTQPIQPAQSTQPIELSLTPHDVTSPLESYSEFENNELEINGQVEQSPSISPRGNTLVTQQGKRIVHRVMGKKGLHHAVRHGFRRIRNAPIKNSEPQHLQDPKEQAQNRQAAQAAQNTQAAQDSQSYNRPNRTQEEQQDRTQEENKSSFGKRAKKVAAGTLVAGGSIFSLFPDESASAATLITNHASGLIKPLIAIIHLFLQ